MVVINNTDQLLRRVQFTNPDFIKDDGTPASSSFCPKTGEDGLSVDLERLTTFDKSIQDRSRFRLYAINAGFTVSLGLENVHDPKENNEAHTLIKGNFTRSISRKLAKSAVRFSKKG